MGASECRGKPPNALKGKRGREIRRISDYFPEATRLKVTTNVTKRRDMEYLLVPYPREWHGNFITSATVGLEYFLFP